MKYRWFLMTFLIVLTISGQSELFAQKVALKNNIAYDIFKTPNLSLEVAMGKQWTLDTQVGMNFFFYSKDAASSSYKTTKWSHWLVQPEVRYWTCEAFNGFFVGLHGHGGQMNVGGISTPFILQNKDGEMKEHRYEGYFYGGGLSAGYQWMLSRRLNLEASVGFGYTRFEYDKFVCTSCGEKLGTGGADYIGPTKATLSLIIFLK